MAEQARSGDGTLQSRMALNPTKAGLEAVDHAAVNEKILEASRGSKFFMNEERKDERVTARIAELLKKRSQLAKSSLLAAERRADRFCERLESEWRLSQVIVLVDMDAFYAAVEMRDNPELRDVPMAVGGMAMITTANYVARRYGVRSAMPGYIALKLCPELRFVSNNFAKYKEVSQQTREIFARYDPDYCSVSLDEAYLDITDYLADRPGTSAEEAVQRLRDEVQERTQLTCSAGIACNRLLAKICAEVNKPDGQFRLDAERDAIALFVEALPIRKVPGIGRVNERLLHALEIFTCKDILEKRAELHELFPPKTFEHFVRAAMGLREGRLEGRRSVGCERTFRDISSEEEILAKVAHVSETVSAHLHDLRLEGRALGVKLKLDTFEVRTRSRALPRYTSDREEIFSYASELVRAELPLRLRLLGVKVTDLRSRDGNDSLSKWLEGGSAPTGRLPAERPAVPSTVTCPVCSDDIDGGDLAVNAHLDRCLQGHDDAHAPRQDRARHKVRRRSVTIRDFFPSKSA